MFITKCNLVPNIYNTNYIVPNVDTQHHNNHIFVNKKRYQGKRYKWSQNKILNIE